jgi:zinc and cadmium transporter
MNILLWILLMTFIDGLLGLAGAFSFFISKKALNKILLFLVAFSVGALLGGALFHLIPEAITELSWIKTSFLVTTGFLLFFLLEMALHWRHCHEGKCKVHPYSHLILYGDGIHNFIDGLLIASAFLVSVPLGILTSILILAHELPQEIGDFAVLVYGGFKRKKALAYNFLAQLTAVLGGIIGYFFLNANNYSAYLLPIAAGGFLYIALNDLIPEVFKERDKKKMIINVLAIILGLLVLISARMLGS